MRIFPLCWLKFSFKFVSFSMSYARKHAWIFSRHSVEQYRYFFYYLVFLFRDIIAIRRNYVERVRTGVDTETGCSRVTSFTWCGGTCPDRSWNVVRTPARILFVFQSTMSDCSAKLSTPLNSTLLVCGSLRPGTSVSCEATEQTFTIISFTPFPYFVHRSARVSGKRRTPVGKHFKFRTF